MSQVIPEEYLPDYMRSRRPFREAITNTIAEPPAAPPDMRDVIRQALGTDIAEATAIAILEMIKAGGPASVLASHAVPKGMIMLTCHPEVYAHVRRLADSAAAARASEEQGS